MMTAAFAAILGLLAPAQGTSGKLTIATGKVEVKAVGAETYAPLLEGSTIGPDTWVRTSKSSLAAIDFGDGTQLQLNRNTEIKFVSSRNIGVREGDIYVIAPDGNKSQFLITVSKTRFRSKGPEFSMGHDAAKQTSTFYMIRGSSTVATRRDSQPVTKGYWCQTVHGVLNTPDQAGETAVVTAWTHPILARRGPKGVAELNARLQKMLPWLGMLPGANDPYEQAFRDSGIHGVTFLIGVLKLDPATQNYKRRIAAAKVVGDLAVLKQAPELVNLLKDAEPDVRVFAARGLKRLAGDDLGHGDDYWKGDSRSAGESKWEAWLKANPDKFR